MKQTKQQRLSSIEDSIRERSAYLAKIEQDIEAVSTAGNNQLFIIRGEISEAETEKARLLKRNYELEQVIREKKRLVES